MATLGVFASAFLLYLGCSYPTIAPRDSADMAAAALTLGVSHPPGYPLYALLGRAWLVLLPWGDPAYRLNVLSAVAGAAAVAGLFILVRRRAGSLGGLAASAIWALSAPLWKFSLLEEKYSLHALFAVALLLLAEGKKENVFARARVSGLLLGLGLVNHQSLLFWVPGALWLWRAEAARHGAPRARLAAAAAAPLALGLGLNAFLWVRLGGLRPALETALRQRYGAATLSAGLARPLTPEATLGLLGYALCGAAEAVSWPAAVCALAGAAGAWRADRARAAGWLLGAALTGPLFVILSRFDPADWVARSVLEPAFLLPALAAAAFAGEAVGTLAARRGTALAAGAALALAAAALLLRAPLPEHRDDFLAYDYVRDLRRAVPPGGAVLVSGDTASFGLRWLGLLEPRARPIEAESSGLVDGRAWLAARAAGDVYVTGLGPASLRALGLPAPGRPLWPAGLAQHISAAPKAPPPSVLRRPRAWARGESYARDARLAYGFASWLAARLLEAQGASRDAVETADLTAVVTDPEDYRLQ